MGKGKVDPAAAPTLVPHPGNTFRSSDPLVPTATDAAQALLPLLREYAAKMAAFNERAAGIPVTFVTAGKYAEDACAADAARLICLHDSLEKPVTDLAREASGLIEHTTLEHLLRFELKLRLDEMEEHLRFTAVMVAELKAFLKVHSAPVGRLRKLVEEHRYEAPF